MAIVTKTLNEILDTPVSPERLEVMNNLKDEDIDFSDIPELTKDDFARAIPYAEFKEKRRQEKALREFSAWFNTQDANTRQSVENIINNLMLIHPQG